MAEKVNVLGTILAVLHPDPHQSAVNRNLFMCATSSPLRHPLLRVVSTEQWRNQNIRVNKQEKNYEYLQDSSKCRYLMIAHHDNMNSSHESCVQQKPVKGWQSDSRTVSFQNALMLESIFSTWIWYPCVTWILYLVEYTGFAVINETGAGSAGRTLPQGPFKWQIFTS